MSCICHMYISNVFCEWDSNAILVKLASRVLKHGWQIPMNEGFKLGKTWIKYDKIMET